MLRFIPCGLVDLERIPQATYSKIWVMIGIRGISIYTFKTRDRASASRILAGLTLGHADQLETRDFPAVEKFLPERGHAVCGKLCTAFRMSNLLSPA